MNYFREKLHPQRVKLFTRIAAALAVLAAMIGVPAVVSSAFLAEERTLVVTLPPRARVDVTINGFCLNRGLPFPGSQLVLSDFAPDSARSALGYAIDQGLTKSNNYGTQLAIWNYVGSTLSAAEQAQAQAIINGAKGVSVPGVPAGSTSILDAVRTGSVSAVINGFYNQ